MCDCHTLFVQVARTTSCASWKSTQPQHFCFHCFPAAAASHSQRNMAPKTKARSSYQRFVNCRDSVVLSLGQNKAAHGISVMSTNVHEHNAAVMLVYAGQKKPIKTDSVSLWGHLLGKKKS